MADDHQRQFFAGLRLSGLGTLVSRVLGMVRDMATAALFGLSEGGVMDAFVVAFRIPNLSRRLFGEGALAVSYLPVLAGRLERDRQSAWRLASVMLTLLSVLLMALLLVAEGVCAVIYWRWGDVPGVALLLGLTATLLPYMVLICLTAQLAATLQALHYFASSAVAPILLNVGWLAGVWFVAPRLSGDKVTQAYVLAVCIVLSGLGQLAMQLPPLVRFGFRFEYNWQDTRSDVLRITRTMVPMVFGLAITQINTMVDTFLAWGLAHAPGGSETIPWLPGAVPYPLSQGAAAAVYYGERLYQFPVGLLGVTVATVIFPLLNRHAARGDRDALGADLSLGLRIVLLLALPASAAMVMLAHPVAELLFARGVFTQEDVTRTARMIACYGAGVWAFCALPVIVRGFYSLADQRTPALVGALMVVGNIAASTSLIWTLGESGLAVGTTTMASLQVSLLAVIFSRRHGRLAWIELRQTLMAAGIATVLMSLACWFSPRVASIGAGSIPVLVGRMAAVGIPAVLGLLTYLATLRLLFSREWALLRSSVVGR